MANIKSSIKRAKIAKIRNLRNKSVKTSVKTAVKKFEAAAIAGDKDLALETFRQAVKKIDSAVAKGVMHKNAAARKKSILARKFNAIN